MIDLNEVGAHPAQGAAGNWSVRLVNYLPGITFNKGYRLRARIIHEADQFTRGIKPQDFWMSWVNGSPLDLWEVTVPRRTAPLVRIARCLPMGPQFDISGDAPDGPIAANITRRIPMFRGKAPLGVDVRRQNSGVDCQARHRAASFDRNGRPLPLKKRAKALKSSFAESVHEKMLPSFSGCDKLFPQTCEIAAWARMCSHALAGWPSIKCPVTTGAA